MPPSEQSPGLSVRPNFPPRGKPNRVGSAPSGQWLKADDLPDAWLYDAASGAVVIGQDDKGRRLGLVDDRHLVTIAGSRAGKSSTVIVPNLLEYPGPLLVIDPKGELAKATADARRKITPHVYVLDPFNATALEKSCHNPLEELRRSPPGNVAADAAQLSEALIIETGGDSHWSDSARNLVKGLILYLHETKPDATLADLRELLNESPQGLDRVFGAMAASDAFDGAMANVGTAFQGMLEYGRPTRAKGGEKAAQPAARAFGREMASILSTARQQTAPLDDVKPATGRKSDFSLADLGRLNATVYLVLPGMRLGTHYRWLRLVVMQALAAMEVNPILKPKIPALFILEEFAALGYIRSIEMAAGYMAGFGARLWMVLQDLSQLKRHYRESWETMLGNAGMVQAFANSDLTTCRYLAERLGDTIIEEVTKNPTSVDSALHGANLETRLPRPVPMLTPPEITFHFSREWNRQLVLIPEEKPIFMDRLPFPEGENGQPPRRISAQFEARPNSGHGQKFQWGILPRRGGV